MPGLIEVITAETTAPGGRHAALAGHEGEIAIRAWGGVPADPKTEASGARWILAVQWVPYQLPTFVTPAFQGYVSGHSTFSRAAAEVMTAMTGSEYFPGGISGYTIPVGSLKIELGPTRRRQAQWATYYDAADQAGQSRLLGGIHIQADDFNGRGSAPSAVWRPGPAPSCITPARSAREAGRLTRRRRRRAATVGRRDRGGRRGAWVVVGGRSRSVRRRRSRSGPPRFVDETTTAGADPHLRWTATRVVRRRRRRGLRLRR